MKLASWLVLVSLGTSILFPERSAWASLDSAQREALRQALAHYSQSESYENYFNSLRETLAPEDIAYLNSRFGKLLHEKPAPVDLNGDVATLRLPDTDLKIKIVEIDLPEIEIHGKRFEYDLDQDFATNSKRLEDETGLKSARSPWNSLIPSAHAALPLAGILGFLAFVAMVIGIVKWLRKPAAVAAARLCKSNQERFIAEINSASEADLNTYAANLSMHQTALTLECHVTKKREDACQELEMLSACLDTLRRKTRSRQSSYNGRIGREIPGAGGNPTIPGSSAAPSI